MKLALAQINPTVGDFKGNVAKILEYSGRAAGLGADLAIFPELSICGYPPADLLEKDSFLQRAVEAAAEVAEAATSGGMAVLCGTVTRAEWDNQGVGKRVHNSAVVCSEGRVAFTQSKMLLPYYDVFDEQRYFAAARQQSLFDFKGERLAITICEDAWNDKNFWQSPRYGIDPVEALMQQGSASGSRAPLLLNISASPYYRDKRELRRKMIGALAKRHGTAMVMVNQVGGNDSLVFDGSSFAIDGNGRVVAQAASFEEDLVLVDTEAMGSVTGAREDDGDIAGIFDALVLGTRDYIRKCGFQKALIALSGGIDSALVLCLAVEAIGAENVMAVGMPSQYSSTGSIEDSRVLAAILGVRFEVLPIEGIFAQYTGALDRLFTGHQPDLTEENLQSRIRGGLLMALSNKFNALVMTTGNKSEMSVGYCTLYGDMVGALAVIGDVVKTDVYRLSRHVNRSREIIPAAIIEKAPSAELRPDQKDTDSLPEYGVLDPILQGYVEHYQTPEAIAAAHGFDIELVRSVVRLVERSEYKRQQAAPVLKVTEKSFGMGRRFPIAAKAQA